MIDCSVNHLANNYSKLRFVLGVSSSKLANDSLPKYNFKNSKYYLYEISPSLSRSISENNNLNYESEADALRYLRASFKVMINSWTFITLWWPNL